MGRNSVREVLRDHRGLLLDFVGLALVALGLSWFTEFFSAWLRYVLLALVAAGFLVRTVRRFQHMSEESSLELQKADQKVYELMNNANDGILVYSLNQPHRPIVDVNEAICKWLGYSREELLQLSAQEIAVTDAGKELSGLLEDLGKQNQQIRELLLQTKDGQIVPVETNTKLVDLEGKLFALSVVRDITERKKAEQELRESETKYRLIAENMSNLICVFDAAGDVVYSSPSQVSVLGREAQSLKVMIAEHVHPEDISEARIALQCILTEQKAGTGEFRYQHGAGHLVDLEYRVTPFPVEDGSTHFLCMFRDITERKRVRLQLIENEQRYKSLFEHNPDAVFSLDGDGHFIAVNSACSIIGYEADELVGRSVFSLVTPNDRARSYEAFHKAKKGEPQSLELSMIHPSGEAIYFSMKQMPTVVDDQVVGVYCIAHDITDKMQSQETINFLAYHDELTTLANGRLFKDGLTQEVKRAQEKSEKLAVMFLDIDRFKIINDSFGHARGDKVIKAVAERLKECVRDYDLIARMGGDEFNICLSHVTEMEDVKVVAKRILQAMQEPFVINETEFHITASIGISLYPTDGEDMETLMKHADHAMYLAKGTGKNTFAFYSEVTKKDSLDLLALESELRKAVERQEFMLHYQPQVSMRTGQFIGVEALVRWNSPSRGFVSPGQFIPVAEETGIIIPLGEQVLRMACQQFKQWLDRGIPLYRIAVNISTQQFQQKNLCKVVEDVLRETGLPPQYLELEITESIAMGDVGRAIEILNDLNALGVQLAIDDFGTGYSSLTYLKNFPVHRLKIDQSFVRDLQIDSGDAAIVNTIIAMAKSLNLDCIAEGVETREQSEFLQDHGCQEAQGYYFSRPLPAEGCEELFAREQWRLV